MTNKRYLYASIGMLSLMIAIAAGTASSTAPSITTTTYQVLEGENLTIGTAFAGTPKGINGLNGAAAGAACACTVQASAIDILTTTPLTRMNAHTNGNWAYQVEIKESAVASVGSGTTYKIEIFKDGVSQGSVYVNNSTADAVNIEGVKVSLDVGGTAPSSNLWEVKVTAV